MTPYHRRAYKITSPYSKTLGAEAEPMIADDIATALAEAEASALRRAAEHMKWRRDNYRNTAGKVADDPAIIPLLDAKADACDNAVDALLALIPSSPSAESDNGK